MSFTIWKMIMVIILYYNIEPRKILYMCITFKSIGKVLVLYTFIYLQSYCVTAGK